MLEVNINTKQLDFVSFCLPYTNGAEQKSFLCFLKKNKKHSDLSFQEQIE